MISWLFLAFLQVTKTLCSDSIVYITVDTVWDGVDNSVIENGITVQPGITLDIWNNQETKTNELSINNGAAFFLTNAFANDMKLEVGGLINYGIMSIANYGSANVYQIIGEGEGSGLFNSGQIYLSNSSSCSLIAYAWENVGAIVISSVGNRVGSSMITIETISGEPIINQGDIFLINQFWEMTQPLTGGGCIQVNDGSLLYTPQIDASNPLDNTIFLNGQYATLLFTPCGATYSVAGFDENSVIESNMLPFSIEYDEQSGVLSVSSEGYTDFFAIGLNYNPDNFCLYGQNTAITYNGPAPNPPPSTCGTRPSPPNPPHQ